MFKLHLLRLSSGTSLIYYFITCGNTNLKLNTSRPVYKEINLYILYELFIISFKLKKLVRA